MWLLLLPILLAVAGLTTARAASPAAVTRTAAPHPATTAVAAPMTALANIPQRAMTRRSGPGTTLMPIGGKPRSGGLTAHAGVAAKSALESLAPAVRAQVEDAISRAASGKVRFPGHDGKVYNNADDLLPRGGSYTEWTAAAAGAKRGAHRVIIDGDPANPTGIYYWDHVNSPVRIGP